MENLKIRVNSKAESKEAQQLFFDLGFAWNCGGTKVVRYPNMPYLYAYSISKDMTFGREGSNSKFINNPNKEITLPELRDLVVLKRNDVGDATHIRGDGKKYFHAKSTDFFYQFSSDGDWLLSTWMNYQLLPQLQPIEKPMKEYLRKNSNGTYSYIGTVRPEHVSDFMIEIPEGATKLISHSYVHLPIMFVKPCANGYSYCYPHGIWSDIILSDIKGRDVFWSRHTLPEELPFIDDEPLQSLNDQYAEIEKVRQDIINSPGHYADSTIECIDAMEAMMTPEQFIGYLRGNVFKYQWRYEKKNGIEDLKKAQWYLDKLTVKVAEKNAPF